MKTYIGLLFSAFLLASSCTDTRYDDIVNDSVYLAKSDLQKQTITVMNEDDYVYNVWVHKGGYFQHKFAGSLAIDYNYLVAYNTSNETNYQMLDEKYYSFNRDFVIEAGANELAVPLTLKTNEVIKNLGYGIFYIPFSVKSKTPDGAVFAEKANFLLALTLQQPILGIDGDNKGTMLLDLSSETASSYEIDITAMLDVEAPEDLEVLYEEAADLLVAGEKQLGASFYSCPQKVTMPKGEQYAENYLTLKINEMPNGRWVIPVRMSTSNDKVKVSDNAYLKLTVVKGSLNGVEWGGVYLQENEIIVSSATLPETLIGKAVGVDAEISSDQSWLNASVKNDDIYMTITEANMTTNKERIATVTLLDKTTLLEKKIKVRQCMSGYGISLNKSLWSIPVFSDNTAGKKNDFSRLFDNFWPANGAESNNSYLELSNRDDGTTPFVLTFDLGEKHRTYNTLGLMPRLQWAQPSPKRVKIEVSDDMNTWTVLGPNASTTGAWDAFTDAEIKGTSNSYENHYEGMVHWFDLGAQTKRYIRLSIFESLYQSTGKVICLNELFVSNK